MMKLLSFQCSSWYYFHILIFHWQSLLSVRGSLLAFLPAVVYFFKWQLFWHKFTFEIKKHDDCSDTHRLCTYSKVLCRISARYQTSLQNYINGPSSHVAYSSIINLAFRLLYIVYLCFYYFTRFSILTAFIDHVRLFLINVEKLKNFIPHYAFANNSWSLAVIW